MRVSSILLARTLAYVEKADLDPYGKISIPDLIKAVAERYKFERLPKREEWDKEGLIFEDGKIGSKAIKKLTIYDVLILLETRSNTTESKQLIHEMLEWATAKLGLTYGPQSIKHYAYISDISFYSDVPLLDDASSPLANVAEKTSATLSEIWGEPIEYHATDLRVGHDHQRRKNAIASFMITRRNEVRFEENKYFSEAPLPTDVHIRILEEFENDVRMRGAATVI